MKQATLIRLMAQDELIKEAFLGAVIKGLGTAGAWLAKRKASAVAAKGAKLGAGWALKGGKGKYIKTVPKIFGQGTKTVKKSIGFKAGLYKGMQKTVSGTRRTAEGISKFVKNPIAGAKALPKTLGKWSVKPLKNYSKGVKKATGFRGKAWAHTKGVGGIALSPQVFVGGTAASIAANKLGSTSGETKETAQRQVQLHGRVKDYLRQQENMARQASTQQPVSQIAPY